MSSARNILLYLVYFLIVVALGVSIVVAFRHHTASKSPVKKPATTQATTDTPPASPSQPAPSSDTAADATRSAIGSGTPSTGSQLANTGPGDTAALFVGASLAGSYGYRRYLLRRSLA